MGIEISQSNENDFQLNKTTRKLAYTVISILGVVNIIVILCALLVSWRYPVLLSPAILAYTLGLRHAVDADHIAAIDNVTRKLMSEKKQPVTIGLYFSLGHSTVVVLLTLVITLSSHFIQNHIETSKEIGSFIGTFVSVVFLFLIGSINLIIFIKLLQQWRSLKNESIEIESMNVNIEESPSTNGGLMSGCCRFAIRVIDKPWKMYPLGFLFGLGFDTASEVALLGISAMASSKGIPTFEIMLLPFLFTAGMSLIDTLDGIMMLWAYGWAFLHPLKKIFYNIFLTGTSAMVAFLVGSIEAIGIIAENFHLKGSFWIFIGQINDNFQVLGFCIIGIFMLSFLLSYMSYQYYFNDTTEQKKIIKKSALTYGSL